MTAAAPEQTTNEGPTRYEAAADKEQPDRSVGGRRRKVPKLERIERRKVISALMAAGVEEEVIKAETAKRFDMTGRATKMAMGLVIKAWAETDVEQRPHKRLMAEKRLQGHVAAARAAKAWGAVASLERLLAEIQGTRQPDEVHVTVEAEVRENVAVVVQQLTPERINELADRALAFRESPRRLTSPLPPPTVVDEPDEAGR
jgi:hypothetical protein